MDELLNRIARSALSTAIRRSDWGVMALESVHLLGLALLFGCATLFALAALRRGGLRSLALPELTTQLWRLAATGLALMVASGTLIAVSIPRKYYLDQAFRAKMLLLALATAATVWLVRVATRGGATAAARALALLAWLLWLGVGVSGRLIGFL